MTGSTGAGRSPVPGTHHPLRHSDLYAYNALAHRHGAEINALARAAAGREGQVAFVPHSGPFARGIHATVQARLAKPLDTAGAIAALRDFYAGRPFVRVLDEPPRMKDVVTSNYAHLSAATDGRTIAVMSVRRQPGEGRRGRRRAVDEPAAGLRRDGRIDCTSSGVDMNHRIDQAAVIAALRGAAPYIRLYKGKVFVIKAGGAIFGDLAGTRSLVEQIAILHHLGIRVVLVHGGGPQLDEMQRSLGIEPRMVRGRRVTDDRSIDATTMVLNGLINTRILAACRELGIDAVGLSGVDAGLVRANRRPPVQVDGESVDYGFVGDIVSIDATVIRKELDAGLMPVVSPISADDAGVVLNINADTVAAAIGAALGGREADPLHRRAGHPRAPRRSPLARVVHRSRRARAAREVRRPRGRHAAESLRHRVGDPRRRAPRARHFLQCPRQRARRSVHQRGHGHDDRRRRQGAHARRTASPRRQQDMNSKAMTIVAIVLIALGAFGLARGKFSYTEEKHEAEIAGIELSVKDKETVAVPQWLSIGAIALGVVLIVVGRRKS